jgi:hypothetical protein
MELAQRMALLHLLDTATYIVLEGEDKEVKRGSVERAVLRSLSGLRRILENNKSPMQMFNQTALDKEPLTWEEAELDRMSFYYDSLTKGLPPDPLIAYLVELCWRRNRIFPNISCSGHTVKEQLDREQARFDKSKTKGEPENTPTPKVVRGASDGYLEISVPNDTDVLAYLINDIPNYIKVSTQNLCIPYGAPPIKGAVAVYYHWRACDREMAIAYLRNLVETGDILSHDGGLSDDRLRKMWSERETSEPQGVR